MLLSHIDDVATSAAPAVSELTAQANWAQEFLAQERSYPLASADFDAVSRMGAAQPMSQNAFMPQRQMYRPFQHW